MKIRCLTLFDITKTNVSNRRHLLSETVDPNLIKQRNQQSNFETLLQIIGLRSQPEDITDPVITKTKLDKKIWGSKYKSNSAVWSFSFTIQHPVVYSNEHDSLGNLYMDCDGVPMIINLEETAELNSKLSSSIYEKNIHFQIEND